MLNFFIPTTIIVPIITWGFEQSVIGLPIMREGFITMTGFLLGD